MASDAIWIIKCPLHRLNQSGDDTSFETSLGKTVVVYFLDIGVYSQTEEEHLVHLHEVFQILQDNALYINLKKLIFLTSQLVFLGYVVSSTGLKVDDS